MSCRSQRAFKTDASSKPVSSVTLGGAPTKKDRVFYSTSQTITGVSKKGKEFFRFDTTLSETITSSFSEETRLWLAASTDYGLFDNGTEMESYAAPDAIQDLAVANVTRDTEPDAVLACKDGAVRVIAAGSSVLEYRQGSGTVSAGSSAAGAAAAAASIGGGGSAGAAGAGTRSAGGVSGARSVHYYHPTLLRGESASLPASSAAAKEMASSLPAGSTIPAPRAGRGHLPPPLSPSRARHFLVGSGAGSVALLLAASDAVQPRWTLMPSRGRAGGGAVNAITSLDVTGDGSLDVVVGRDDGSVDVLGAEAGPHDPAVVFSHQVGDAVQSLQAAAVSSPGDGEVLAVSFSGKLLSLTTESLSAAAEGDSYGRSKEVVEREARVVALRSEMSALEEQVEKQR